MPPGRKRRAVEEDEDEIAATQTQTQRRRRPSSSFDEDDDVDMEEEGGGSSLAQLSKAFVRYALACEYARVPIRRQDVNQKVLGPAHTREFRRVFDDAKGQLLDIFGMELVELPVKDRVTLDQKRKNAAAESQSKTSNQWVLRTTLPEEFRTPDIMGPPAIPTADTEETYGGLYTTVIALITLCGGILAESRLERFLKRLNADESVPGARTEKVLGRMAKEGYIVRVKTSSSGEELVDYTVGARGKVEVGEEGVGDFVRRIYGGSVEDLEARLSRSLGLVGGGAGGGAGAGGGGAVEERETATRGRPRRHATAEEDE